MKHKWILTITIVIMLAYQAWRVFDYMSTSMMGVDQNTSFFVSLAFLTFTEIGLLVWLHVAQPGSTTDKQENTAKVMIWVDFCGSMILGLADLAKHNTMYTIDLSRLDPVLFIAPWVIVAANVAAWIIFETNDSGKRLEQAERRLTHAEHELEIQARLDAIADLNANRQGLSKQLAPYYSRDIQDRITGRTAKRFLKEGEKLSLPELPPIAIDATPKKPSLKEMINNAKKAIGIAKPEVMEIHSNGNGNGAGDSQEGNFTERQ